MLGGWFAASDLQRKVEEPAISWNSSVHNYVATMQQQALCFLTATQARPAHSADQKETCIITRGKCMCFLVAFGEWEILKGKWENSIEEVIFFHGRHGFPTSRSPGCYSLSFYPLSQICPFFSVSLALDQGTETIGPTARLWVAGFLIKPLRTNRHSPKLGQRFGIKTGTSCDRYLLSSCHVVPGYILAPQMPSATCHREASLASH